MDRVIWRCHFLINGFSVSAVFGDGRVESGVFGVLLLGLALRFGLGQRTALGFQCVETVLEFDLLLGVEGADGFLALGLDVGNLRLDVGGGAGRWKVLGWLGRFLGNAVLGVDPAFGLAESDLLAFVGKRSNQLDRFLGSIVQVIQPGTEVLGNNWFGIGLGLRRFGGIGQWLFVGRFGRRFRLVRFLGGFPRLRFGSDAQKSIFFLLLVIIHTRHLWPINCRFLGGRRGLMFGRECLPFGRGFVRRLYSGLVFGLPLIGCHGLRLLRIRNEVKTIDFELITNYSQRQMSVFKQPLGVAPGPKQKHDANREADTMRAVGEVRGVLDRLINALAPYRPSTVTGADGRRLGVLAFDQGTEDIGPRLHNVTTLTAGLTDPFDITASVITAVIDTITVPDPTSFVSALSGHFAGVLAGGSAPSRATIEALVSGYMGSLSGVVGDIGAAVTAELAARALGLDTILETHFATSGVLQPRNGDYIYSEATGIAYVLFKQKDSVPSANTIFRVPFVVGTTTWVALTLFPAPNIAGFATSIASLALAAVNALLALVSALVVNVIMSLFSLIEGIVVLINAVYAAITAAINALEAALMILINALDDRVTTIEGLLENITTADIINTAGFAQTITVLNKNTGAEFRTEITWIDSSTGEGQIAKTLIWDGPFTNLEDVDWRTIYWMGQDGTHKSAKLLSLNTGGYPKVEDDPAGDLFETADVVTCENGEITILKRDT